jgi:repressor LexA
MKTKEKLSSKQEQVLSFLKKHVQDCGYPPTVREIAASLGMAGPHGAKKILDILERKGYIRKTAHGSRAIDIVGSRAASPVLTVPIVGTIRAGTPLLAVENIEGSVAIDPMLARGEGLFALRVQGNSMIEASILDGDLALIRPQARVEQGEIAAVIINDEATIKYFFREKASIRLQPANARMKPIVIREGQAEVMLAGKVIAIIRRMES